MKEFDAFAKQVRTDKQYQRAVEKRLWKELSATHAMALVGQSNAKKIVQTVSEVSIDVCLSMLRAYHEWTEQGE